MPRQEQVEAMVAAGIGYPEIGRRLGISAGQAYLIGTGSPADGSEYTTAQGRPGALTSAQHLVNPPFENPTARQSVRDWIAARVAADPQMRQAGAAQKAQEES